MKILMFGRGAITVMYGWAFEKDGHKVDFYVRPGSGAKYGKTLNISITDDRKNADNVEQIWNVRLREDLPSDHDYELIILSVQHYKFKDAAAFLADKVAKATILVFNNFWQDPLEQAAILPISQLAWGFPQAGSSFSTNGHLRGVLFDKVHFGTFGTEPTGREMEVRALFTKIGFKIQEHHDFKGWLWIHFAVVTGFYACALPSKTVGSIMASANEGQKAILQIRELLNVVEARGVDLSKNKNEFSLYRMPVWLGAFILRLLMRFNKPFKIAFSGRINVEEAKLSCKDVMETGQQLDLDIPQLKARQVLFI